MLYKITLYTGKNAVYQFIYLISAFTFEMLEPLTLDKIFNYILPNTDGDILKTAYLLLIFTGFIAS
jgi:hypothetical protein